MNQSVLFNDDYNFCETSKAWVFTGQMSGQLIRIYIKSPELEQLTVLSQCIKFDLEERVELWLEKNEPEGNDIHITMAK